MCFDSVAKIIRLYCFKKYTFISVKKSTLIALHELYETGFCAYPKTIIDLWISLCYTLNIERGAELMAVNRTYGDIRVSSKDKKKA